ncbi:CBS domain-containing protein CBSX3, mitochondrial-like [Nymphaea colorata]|nr:CBS domain-containing protein CBSX3, mitochondrial-like [Nymphaea colorata]
MRGSCMRNLLLQGRPALWNPATRSNNLSKPNIAFPHFRFFASGARGENSMLNTTVEELLKQKDKSSLIWCHPHDSAYDAAKKMTQHDVGALVVVKPGERKLIAGIITERDYMRKVVIQERSPKATKVGDIMTGENKLITVASDTSLLQAMQLMTEYGIRHVPVIDEKMTAIISIRDVIQAIVEEQEKELKRLNEFIQRGY